MAIRMTGLISNMDTESIIKQLMSAQGIKKTRVENKKTKLEWEQDKWKELNTKIYKFYTDQAAKMRLQGSYQTKKATSSNEDKVTVTSSTTAPQGSQTLEITQLASTQYTTSGQVTGSGITASSKLVGDLLMKEGTVINITSGTGASAKTAVLDVDANTTVFDFVQKCKDAGLNASFDEAQKRFFISSKESGAANTYTITSSSYEGASSSAITNRNNIRNITGYTKLSTADKTTIDNAINTLRNATSADMTYVTSGPYVEADASTSQKVLKSAYDTLTTAVEKAANASAKAYATDKVKTELKNAITSYGTYDTKDYSTIYADLETSTWDAVKTSGGVTGTLVDAKAAVTKANNGLPLDLNETKLVELYNTTYTTELNKNVDALVATDMTRTGIVDDINTRTTNIVTNGLVDGTTIFTKLSDLKETLKVNATSLVGTTMTSGTTGNYLSNLGLGEITSSVASNGYNTGTGMVVIKAANSKIKLNDALLEGTTNTMQVNGLTLNLKAQTATGEKLTIGVSDDTDAVYNMVKNFVKEYNTLLKEMNTLYYASTAKGFEPLSDEEKEAMSDDQIEKWENKIKDSLLRRDDKLGSITSTMKMALSGSVKVDGKDYSLASFGIMTSVDFTEKGLLHIYGNQDDPTYSDREDKLKKALATDPDTFMKAFSGLATKLYDSMTTSMKTSSLNSALTFYNDKQITKQIKEYDSQINDWEDRLKRIEDRYYKQFSAMETAMAKLNSQSSSLAGMFGNS